MAVQRNLCLYLLGFDAAQVEGVLLVDELDGDDGLKGVFRAGFPNATDGARVREFVRWANASQRWVGGTYKAYAPWPMVREMMRNGRFSGRGNVWT